MEQTMTMRGDKRIDLLCTMLLKLPFFFCGSATAAEGFFWPPLTSLLLSRLRTTGAPTPSTELVLPTMLTLFFLGEANMPPMPPPPPFLVPSSTATPGAKWAAFREATGEKVEGKLPPELVQVGALI